MNRPSRFDALGLACVLAFIGAFIGLRWGARAPSAEQARAQLLDSSTEIQEGEEWLGLYLGAERAGYIHLEKAREPTGWRYRVETRFRLLGAAGGEVALVVDAHLDAALALSAFEFDVDAGPARFGGRGTVDGQTLTLAIETGGETVTRALSLPRPPVLRSTLGPLLARLDHTPGARTTLQLFDPLTQRDEPVEIEVVGPDTLVVLGEQVAVTHIRQHSRGMALDAWLNARGELLRQELGLGLVAVRETEEEARFGLVQARSGRAGADLRALTAIPVAGMPDDVATRKSLRLRIQGAEGLKLDDDRQQRVDDVLVIRREPAWPGLALDAVAHDDPDLAPEPLIQADHPRIQAVARRVVGDAADTREAAERLRRFVHGHVDEEVVAGVPSALEVLENGRGDCNEHAVLFAALARAAGVPTRIETGLVYQDGRFAWHAWNSVRVTLGWLSVDATWDQQPVDVGHLRLATGGLDAQADLLRLMGQLRIEVAK
ncbi:MAG: transglutaminase-like domain-containing protein [bacterium]